MRVHFRRSARLGLGMPAEVLEHRSLLSATLAGVLDTSFNNTGEFVFGFHAPAGISDQDRPFQVLYQTDGKLLQAGFITVVTSLGAPTQHREMTVIRYNTDGTIDSGFGNSGVVVLPILDSVATGLGLSTGGQIVVLGVQNLVTNGQLIPRNVVVARLTAAGALDASFATQGVFNQPTPHPASREYGGVNADGSIVFAGDGGDVGRLTAAGALDPTFAGTGLASFPPLTGFALQPNGKALLGLGPLVERLTTAGVADSTFNSVGFITTPLQNVYGLALQTNGQIVVAGSLDTAHVGVFRLDGTNGLTDATFNAGSVLSISGFQTASDFAPLVVEGNGEIVVLTGNVSPTLVGVTPTGSLDASFGTMGSVSPGIPFGPEAGSPTPANVFSLAVSLSNQVALSGFGFPGNPIPSSSSLPDEDFAIAAYNANGTAATTFHTTGTALVPLSARTTPDLSEASFVIQRPTGKLLVAGFTQNTPHGQQQLALARIAPDGSLDPSFGAAGKVMMTFGADSVVPVGFAVQENSGSILVALAPDPAAPANRSYLVRFNFDGSIDTTFGTGGTLQFDSAGLASLAVQSDGGILLGGQSLTGGILGQQVANIVRLHADGTLDASFSAPAVVNTLVQQIVVQADGKLLLATAANIMRLLPSGAVDPTFGTNGIGADSGVMNPNSRTLAVTPTGLVVVGGVSKTVNPALHTSVTSGFLYRLGADGSLDLGFGVRTTAGLPQKVVIEPTGTILVAEASQFQAQLASQSISERSGTIIERYASTGVPDPTFMTDTLAGPLLSSARNLGVIPHDMLLDPSGRLIVTLQRPTDNDPRNSTLPFGFALAAVADFGMPTTPHRLFRVYNPDPNHAFHFFTTSRDEFNFLVSIGWQDETSPGKVPVNTGVAFEPAPGTLSLHRLYNVGNGQHYITTSDGERDVLLGLPHGAGQGWTYEGDIGYVFANAGTMGTTEIFRLYNVQSGEHLYLTDASEKDGIVQTFAGTWVEQSPLGWGFTLSPGTTPTVDSASATPSLARLEQAPLTVSAAGSSTTPSQAPALAIAPERSPGSAGIEPRPGANSHEDAPVPRQPATDDSTPMPVDLLDRALNAWSLAPVLS